MVIIDKDTKTSFQKPFRPTSKSGSLVITLPKFFTEVLRITSNTELRISIGNDNNSIVIRKIRKEEGRKE